MPAGTRTTSVPSTMRAEAVLRLFAERMICTGGAPLPLLVFSSVG